MAVSNEVIFERMMEEIERAKDNEPNIKEQMLKVKLLCDLLIESNKNNEPLQKLTITENKRKKQNESINNQPKIVQEDPYSIFDF